MVTMTPIKLTPTTSMWSLKSWSAHCESTFPRERTNKQRCTTRPKTHHPTTSYPRVGKDCVQRGLFTPAQLRQLVFQVGNHPVKLLLLGHIDLSNVHIFRSSERLFQGFKTWTSASRCGIGAGVFHVDVEGDDEPAYITRDGQVVACQLEGVHSQIQQSTDPWTKTISMSRDPFHSQRL